jgi:hypothetical protein
MHPIPGTRPWKQTPRRPLNGTSSTLNRNFPATTDGRSFVLSLRPHRTFNLAATVVLEPDVVKDCKRKRCTKSTKERTANLLVLFFLQGLLPGLHLPAPYSLFSSRHWLPLPLLKGREIDCTHTRTSIHAASLVTIPHSRLFSYDNSLEGAEQPHLVLVQ